MEVINPQSQPRYARPLPRETNLGEVTIKIPDPQPGEMTHVPIPVNPNMNTSQSSFTITSDMAKGLRSLNTFKDLFVSRKRINIGQVLSEGMYVVKIRYGYTFQFVKPLIVWASISMFRLCFTIQMYP